MKLIKPSYEILSISSHSLEIIEIAGRTCYKSEDKITYDSAIKFVQKLNTLGHESVIEHSMMTVKFIVDRGVSHELVRHRLCSFSQESTRYCNYKEGVTFIIPPWIIKESITFYTWKASMAYAETCYMALLADGWSPQQARSVLPNSLKTELVMTANFREWKHIFKLRTSKAAHPQMREVMIPLLSDVKERIPAIFDSISVEA